MKSRATILLLLARSAAVTAESQRLRSVRHRPPSPPGHDQPVRRIEHRTGLRGGLGDGLPRDLRDDPLARLPRDLWDEPLTAEERRCIEDLVRRAGELLRSLDLLGEPLGAEERRHVERLERRAEEVLRYLECTGGPGEALAEEERRGEGPSNDAPAEEQLREDLEYVKRTAALYERAEEMLDHLEDLERRRGLGFIAPLHEDEPLSEQEWPHRRLGRTNESRETNEPVHELDRRREANTTESQGEVEANKQAMEEMLKLRTSYGGEAQATALAY